MRKMLALKCDKCLQEKPLVAECEDCGEMFCDDCVGGGCDSCDEEDEANGDEESEDEE